MPAYNQCAAPNRTHGPPLAFPSCNPPVQSSGFVTVGTPDANGAGGELRGFAKYEAIVGVPGGVDDSDVEITVNITDVRNKVGLADYTGQLQVTHGCGSRTA